MSIVSLTDARAHGDLHEKIDIISQKLAESPTADLYFQRATLQFNHGDSAAALIDLDWIDKHAPDEVETDPLRSEALLLLGRNEAALATLDRFIKHHPDASRCIVNRARVHGKLGNTQAAIRDYQTALALSPNAEPDLFLEVAEAFVIENRPEDAIKILDGGIAKLGAVPALALRALDLEILAGDWERSLVRIAALQAAAPRPEPWMARRASVLSQAGRPTEARLAWHTLIDHIASLTPSERDSTAMTRIAAQALNAISSLPSE